MQYLLDIAPEQPVPSELTPAAGTVVYRLYSWLNSPQATNDAPLPIGYQIVPVAVTGLLAIRVNGNETITVEVMPAVTDPAVFRGLTNAKRTYRR